MSSFDRRRVLILPAVLAGAFALGGCFRPMLAETEPSVGLMGKVAFPKFDDRFGYYLNDSLRDRLGRTEAPLYQLVVRTYLKKDNLAIAQDNSVTRVSLTATADWKLYRFGDEVDPRMVESQHAPPESMVGGNRQTSPSVVLHQLLGKTEDAGPAPLLSGQAVVQSGYNSTSSLYATRTTKLDIERRLAVDLGERISRVILARAGQIEAAAAAAPAGS